MPALDDDQRRQMTAAHLDRIWPLGDPPSWVAVGVGGEHRVEAGKVRHGHWDDRHFRWPAQRDQLLEYVIAASVANDVYVTPGRRENPVRNERAKHHAGRFLWCDLDGAGTAQLARLDQLLVLGSFTVASGRGPGHVHFYLLLNEPAAPQVVETLNRRLVAHLGGDPSPSSLNGYLRPAGTLNQKPAWLDRSDPVLVQITTITEGPGWLVADLDDTLPPAPRGKRFPAAGVKSEPLPDRLPPQLERALDAEPDDRSEHLYSIVAAAFESGLTHGQAVTAAGRHQAVVAKYGPRLVDEVGRIWSKLGPGPTADDNGSEEADERSSGPGADRDSRESRSALADCEAVFDKWLPTADPVPRRAVWAAFAANQLPGDPCWLMLVGGSGSGKTETITSVAGMPGVLAVSTVTGPAALLSGSLHKDRVAGATGGLLRQIGERGTLVLKDFTSIIAMRWEPRGEVLSALRECYDGHWERPSGGDGGRILGWSGHLGVIAGCTDVIDSAHAVLAAMGERFLFVRVGQGDDDTLAVAALANVGREEAMRCELAEATTALLKGLPDRPATTLTDTDTARLVALAGLAARARSPIEHDRDGELELVLASEAPTRLVKELAQLWRGCTLIGLDSAASWEVVARAGLDSIPKLRRALIGHLSRCAAPVDTEHLGEAIAYPSRTVRRTLIDLAAHGIVARSVSGRAHRWSLTDWTRTRLGSVRAGNLGAYE